MRKTNLTFLTWLAITIGAFCVAVTSAHAQAVTPIFGFDNQSWQYYQAGNEPANISGLNWRTNTYNDTAWQTGFGYFAFEPDSPAEYDPLNTPLNRYLPDGTTPINTYYFRTHFNFPISTNNIFLYFTNVVDDGLVLYLNGVRLYDLRVSANPPTYATFAGGTPAEGAKELVIMTNGAARLRQGDNVLAVEVHDSSATSTDVGFGLGLAYRGLAPITIVQQPTNSVDAFIGDSLDLSVQVIGDNPRYWWFRDTVFTGQTNANLRINNLQVTNSGNYYVIVSNTISGARSSNSVVTVVPDTIPPEFTAAAINEGDTNRVYALFTEDVLPVNLRNPSLSATNLANYSLTEVGNTNNKITITTVTVGRGQKSVRLTLATNIDCSKEYVLRVSNLTDTRTNLMSPNPGYQIVGCVYRANIVDFQAFWNFNATYVGADPGLPTNWYTTNYQVDGTWSGGFAPFYYAQGCFSNCYGSFGVACPGQGTPTSVGYPTYAFRKEFVVNSNSPTIGLLRLSHVIDDGAIFYLNGKELLRYNMTNAPVDFNYLAPCLPVAQCQTQSYTLDNLIIGTNLFCVEVHSCDEFTGADFMFGCEMDIIFTNFPTVIPEIKIRQTSNPKREILSWQPRGWRLQTTTNVGNPASWANVVGITTNFTGYTNNPTDRWRFWRLCRP
ncbi:MAG TPA: immunoglobulin domain-containing protein [Verrucomicrobiae bacterium]|nr:immunoglobulin domain-containing protein [Verrucomicrobiae bacterium]